MSMGVSLALAATEAALVLYAVNNLVSIPDLLKTSLSHRLIVSLETAL